MAATVSVSSPACTAAASARCRCTGDPSPSSVELIAAHAAWKAFTVNPLGENVFGSTPVASWIHVDHCPRRSSGSRSSPEIRSNRPSSTATRTASDHRTHESPANGSVWVSSARDRAVRALVSRESSRVRPTTPVRIRAPLPAVCPFSACSRSAASRSRCAAGPSQRPAWVSTTRVWVPTSLAPPCSHPSNAAATSSCAAAEVRSPRAATRAIHSDIWVSSLHSPGT
ncbi:hypothetical protein GCM10009657_19310 [Oryzihumus leptocrescens]